MEKKIKSGWDSRCGFYQCSDGEHLSFWQAIIRTKQWSRWKKEVARRWHRQMGAKHYKGVFDVEECETCGWVSGKHIKAFLEFVRNYRVRCENKK